MFTLCRLIVLNLTYCFIGIKPDICKSCLVPTIFSIEMKLFKINNDIIICYSKKELSDIFKNDLKNELEEKTKNNKYTTIEAKSKVATAYVFIG